MEEQILAFIEYLARRKHYAGNTLAAYRQDLFQFHQFVTTERPHLSSWARVDTLLLQAFLLQLRAREYSPASVARKVAAIKSFYFYLFEEHAIAANPTLELDAPRVAKRAPQALTEGQVNALLAAATDSTPKGYRDRALLEVLYATGIRVTELVTLQIDDLDLETATLRIGKDEAGADGSNRSRDLPLNERAVGALRDYLQNGRLALKVPPDAGPLFANPRGEPLTRQGVWLILKQYVKEAGIDVPVTPHSLRHSFAAHRLERGERVQDLQRLLGHAHLSTTQAYNRRREFGSDARGGREGARHDDERPEFAHALEPRK
jgi:integrase/recombinase XerD